MDSNIQLKKICFVLKWYQAHCSFEEKDICFDTQMLMVLKIVMTTTGKKSFL